MGSSTVDVCVMAKPVDTKVRAHDLMVDEYGEHSIVCIQIADARLQFHTRAAAAAWLQHTVAAFNEKMAGLDAPERVGCTVEVPA